MPLLTAETSLAIGRPTQFNSVTGAIAGRIGGKHPKDHLRKRPPKADSWEERAKQTAVNRQLRLIAEQVNLARKLLKDTTYRYCEECKRGGVEPHHRAQLLRALSQLLEDERILRQIAPPAPARPDKPRRTISISAMPEPVPIQAQVAQESPGTQPVVESASITQASGASGSDSKPGN